ncbi:hypothetical protein NBRC116584_02670 [Hydrogenophaga sp. 5NK40-0174]
MALKAAGFSHRLYRLAIRLLLLPLLGWLWWRGRAEPGYRTSLDQRLGLIDIPPQGRDGVLLHAASVGELQAARSLIDSLQQRWPAHSITVSTQTPTGAQTLRQYFGSSVRHVYLPADIPGAVRRFLDALRPQCVILMERELWPELIWQCEQRCIPVALVNARLSERSARGYRKWHKVMASVWPALDLVAAADQPSLERYRDLGVPADRIMLAGNLKFELGQGYGKATAPEAYANRLILVAGSTHAAEEAQILPLWKAFVQRHPQALLVLVPRHPQRFDEVANALRQHDLPFARHSLGEEPSANTPVVLGDTMGELMRWYGMAKLAFIGGSLAPVGGHNALEALACGCPVLYGPHTHNFDALFDSIEEKEAGQRVQSAEQLLAVAESWLADPEKLEERGRLSSEFVQAHKGANARTVEALEGFWKARDLQALCRIDDVNLSNQTIWLDPDITDTLTPEDFNPDAAATDAAILPTGSGRGQVLVKSVSGHQVVLRHYRRGGMVAKLSRDVFWRRTDDRSRAMEEFALLRLLRSWALPVPRPVAARHAPVGLLGYRSDIMVEMIPGSRNAADRLQQAPLSHDEWVALGTVTRRMHDLQVFHSDLNCHNLLLDTNGHAWIVDFDKCRVRTGQDWKQANLERLQRSLRKEQGRMRAFHWSEAADWPAFMQGYEPNGAQRY